MQIHFIELSHMRDTILYIPSPEPLSRKGCNLNDKNKEFLTPLHIATDKSHYDVMELLLKHGAKVGRSNIPRINVTIIEWISCYKYILDIKFNIIKRYTYDLDPKTLDYYLGHRSKQFH